MNSPVIRSLNCLCLIAAMLAQPMMVGNARMLCRAAGESAATAHACGSCGNCEVRSSDDLCGCCCSASQSAAPQNEPEESSCCGNHSSEPAESERDTTEPEALEGKVPDSAAADSTARNPDDLEAVAAERNSAGDVKSRRQSHVAFSGKCLCALHPQPGTPTTPRIPVSQEPTTKSLVSAELGSSLYDQQFASRLSSAAFGPLSLRCLDTQRYLCVWRL